MQSVLRYVEIEADDKYAAIHPNQIANWVIRSTRKPWLMRNRRCLRQGLLGTRFMRIAGYDPHLVFGVSPESLQAASIAAHCWVELEGIPVLNDSQGMQEIYRWQPS